jgi:hypothetical protein
VPWPIIWAIQDRKDRLRRPIGGYWDIRTRKFQKALDANDPDFQERVRLAKTKLLAKFGVSWEHERKEIAEALERMEAGLSEHYKSICRRFDA